MASASQQLIVGLLGAWIVGCLWWMWRHPESMFRANPLSWFMKEGSDSWNQLVESNRVMALAFLVIIGVGLLVVLIAVATDYLRALVR